MDPGLFLLLALVVLIAVSVLALALMNRVVFKMAARNFSRRKAQSAIVVAGLMVGTAIISASLVVGDTMRYIFEVETYRSLGEVDHEIYGISPVGGIQFFDYGVYRSVSENLSRVEGIEAVAPAIFATISVQDQKSTLAEPSVTLSGLDSSIMRRTVFGDLDGHGYYTDSLGPAEVAINSRLADSLDAGQGDPLTLLFGRPNASNPLAGDFTRANFTISRIIQEKDLYGKANLGQRKALFIELSVAQDLLGRPGQINTILISNSGDMYAGESWSPRVNTTIRQVLDRALGMRELGLSLTLTGEGLEMASALGYFPADYAAPLLARGAAAGARSLSGTLVPVVKVAGNATRGLLVLGVNTTDSSYPPVLEGFLFALPDQAAARNITNGSALAVSALGLDGTERTVSLAAAVLPPGFEATLPPWMLNSTLGFVGPATARALLTGGVYPTEMLTFTRVYGIDNATLATIASEVGAELDARITSKEAGIEVHDVKYDNLKMGRAGGDSISQIFMIFSIFSIIAGVVLIINIFVMLAEERKSEMGMARAVGMKQRHLVRMFLFEGTIYVFIASAVGALMGLGLGYLLVLAFGYIFSATGGGSFPFFFKWESVLLAFCLGVLLTFVTIFFASRRSARLNIIRAIRRIPEPRGARAMKSDLQLGAVALAFGTLITLYAAGGRVAWAWLAGPSLLFLGAGLLAYKWVSIRAAMSFSSVAILVWVFNPFPLPLVSEATGSGSGLDLFIVSGMVLVLAGVLLVMFNSEMILKGLQRSVGSTKATRATLKTAVSYPMDRKGRTGMTLAMFALIIFTVTVIAMIASMQASMMENMRSQQSGGYDVIGFSNPGTPFQNLTRDSLPANLSKSVRELQTVNTAIIKVVHFDESGGAAAAESGPPVSVSSTYSMLVGAGEDFLENNGFPLEDRDKNYSSDRECWRALAANRSLCIIDGSRMVPTAIQAGPSFGGAPPGAYVGGTVTITDLQGQNRTRTFRVIGIMYQKYFIQGLFVQKEMVKQEYNGPENLVFVKLNAGENADPATKEFKKAFVDNGLNAYDINAIITLVTTTITNVMYLMEGFLALGLLIGIAGIGIISYRNVIERRQQIGMMRAIGFRRRMITASFLIETSFVTILATVVGLLLGVGIGWQIFDSGGFKELGASFVVPWLNLLVIAAGAYIATLIFTFYPSIMAARVPPAEALRYIE